MCDDQSQGQSVWKRLDLQRLRSPPTEIQRDVSEQLCTRHTWPQHHLNTTHWRRSLSLCWSTTRCRRYNGLQQCSTYCSRWFIILSSAFVYLCVERRPGVAGVLNPSSIQLIVSGKFYVTFLVTFSTSVCGVIQTMKHFVVSSPISNINMDLYSVLCMQLW